MVSDTVCSGLQHAMLHQPSASATNRVLIDFVQLCCVLCDVCTVGAVHWTLETRRALPGRVGFFETQY